jgi:hypothetical protein
MQAGSYSGSGREPLLRSVALLYIALTLLAQPAALALQAHSQHPAGQPARQPSSGLTAYQEGEIITPLFNTSGLYVAGAVLLHAEGVNLTPYIAAYDASDPQEDKDRGVLFAPNGTVAATGAWGMDSHVYSVAYWGPSKLALLDSKGYQYIVDAQTLEWSWDGIPDGNYYTISTIDTLNPLPNPSYYALAIYSWSYCTGMVRIYEYEEGWRYIREIGYFDHSLGRPEEDMLLPLDDGDNLTMFAAVNCDTEVGVDVVVYNWSSGGFSVFEVNASDASAAKHAVAAAEYGVRYAAIRVPWYAGYDGAGHLFVYRVGWGSIAAYDMSQAGFSDVTFVDIVDVNGSQLVLLAGYTYKSGVYLPELALVDPGSGGVAASRVLYGYPSLPVRAALGLYGGVPVVYLALQDRLVAVRLSDLGVIGVRETGVDDPVAVWFSSNSPYSVVAVAGYTGGEARTEFYLVNAEGIPVSVSLQAPGAVYANVPFNVTVSLEDFNGNPVGGATVVVAEAGESSLRNLTSLVTGPDGVASGRVVLGERGVHRLVAYYPGNGSLTAGFSRQVEVVVTELANATLSLSSESTVEGFPVTATVALEDAVTGSPLSGVWVVVEANTTSGWVSVGAGLTDDSGLATVPLSLPTGNYTLRLRLATPYVELAAPVNATLHVTPPGVPPPEGPYVSPVGRVLAFPPVAAEAGEEASVYFAFYYGENPAAPSQVSVSVTPETPATVTEVQPGLYRVTLTPQTAGLYTVVFAATYNYATYVGVASFYVYDIESRLSEWEASIDGLIESLEDANQTVHTLIESLQALNESVAGFLEGLNASTQGFLGSLNATVASTLASFNEELNYTILTYLDSMNNTITIYLRGINDTISYYLGELLDALQAANMTAYYALLLQVNRTQATLLADLGSVNETLSASLAGVAGLVNSTRALVVENWEAIAGLNSTVYSLASRLNASIDDVRVMVARNGELVAEVNTSLAGLVAGANASLAGLLEAAEGDLYALITSKAGLILADLEALGYNLSLVAGNVSTAVSLIEALASNQSLLAQAILDSINGSAASILSAVEGIGVDMEGLAEGLAGYIASAAGNATSAIMALNATLNLLANATVEEIAARALELAENQTGLANAILDALAGSTLEIETSIGALNVSLGDALQRLGLVQGILVSLNATAAEIVNATGGVETVLLTDLKPAIINAENGVALLNTSLGVVVADLDTIKESAATIANAASNANRAAAEISQKLDTVMEKLDNLTRQVSSQQANLSKQATEASRKASRAYIAGVAGVGVGSAGLLAALATLLRRP